MDAIGLSTYSSFSATAHREQMYLRSEASVPKDQSTQNNQTVDTVELSDAALRMIAKADMTKKSEDEDTSLDKDARLESTELSDAAKKMVKKADQTTPSAPGELSKEDEVKQAQIEKLKERDAAVKAHEQAHKANGGSYAGEIVLNYAVGPDGRQYAKDGYINFNMSPEGTPAQTIAKANAIYRAAMAPSDPSAADLAVAEQAKEMRARAVEQEKAAQSR